MKNGDRNKHRQWDRDSKREFSWLERERELMPNCKEKKSDITNI